MCQPERSSDVSLNSVATVGSASTSSPIVVTLSGLLSGLTFFSSSGWAARIAFTIVLSSCVGSFLACGTLESCRLPMFTSTTRQFVGVPFMPPNDAGEPVYIYQNRHLLNNHTDQLT